MPVSIQMIDFGSTMATRQRGEELRGKVLEIADEASHLVLDFRGVLSVSSSFADEFIGTLAISESDREVDVINARDEVQSVIDSVIERRRSFVPTRRLALDESPWQSLNDSLDEPGRFIPEVAELFSRPRPE